MILELENVTVNFTSGPPFRRRILPAMKNVSLHVAKGETLGLVGESGSGKTTTSRVALGLRRQGQVGIAGDVRRERRRGREARLGRGGHNASKSCFEYSWAGAW